MKTIYYFSATHWDREWYRTFQNFRYKLVNVIDDLLDFLDESDDFKVFHMDGQTVVLRDYLDIRPQNRGRLEKHIRNGRIVVGPWFCMPDEHICSGESLINNLRKGMKLAANFGAEPMKIGYICDCFGHTEQMPQIFSQLGMIGAMLWRGANEENCPAFFKWQAPNGMSVNTYKIRDDSGYGSFAVLAAGISNRNEDRDPEDPGFIEKMKTYINYEINRSELPYGVVMDGLDHEPVHKKTSSYIKKIRESFPSIEVKHENIENLFRQLKSYDLPVKKGELIESGKISNYLIAQTLSSRIKLKQKNNRCEALLEKGLQPLSFFIPVEEEYIDLAWEYLLKNHPHDSICGCSLDSVHEDTYYRYSQVENIYNTITEEGPKLISEGYKIVSGNGGYITIINTRPFVSKEEMEVKVPFDKSFPKNSEPFGYQGINSFKLYSDGDEIPYTITAVDTDAIVIPRSEQIIEVDLYTVRFICPFNGFGIKSIEVRPCEKIVRTSGSMFTSDRSFENEFVKVKINDDGSIDLNGYKNILNFISDGEIADGWNSVRPVCDRAQRYACLKGIEILNDNDHFVNVKIKREMLVPVKTANFIRSEEYTVIPLEIYLSLSKNEKQLRIRLTINNTAENHRMRLSLPIQNDSGLYSANTSFAFVERKAGQDVKTFDFFEKDPLEKPMHGIVLKRDSDMTGLAFVGKYGFYECGVSENEIFVTLFRSFSKVYFDRSLQNSKEPGNIEYEFMLVPLDASISDITLGNMQDSYQTERTCIITAEDKSCDIMKITSNICVSTLKKESSGGMIRLYNPGKNTENAILEIPFSHVYTADLNGNKNTEIPVINNRAEITVGPFDIVTLHMS